MRNKFFNISIKPQQGFVHYVILGIIVIASIMRIMLYGDPNLSIAGNDTLSYVESSQAPLFSSEIMTGRRLLTTNIIYKVFEPKEGYQILVNGSIGTTRRAFQPGFNRITFFQLIMSITGWGFLAFSVSRHIINPSTKVLSAIIVLFFAFTPQMADWDSILMSESLTFSLFALQLALLINTTFFIFKDLYSKTFPYLVLAWAIIYFMWTFLRDTNIFASLVTIGMVAVSLFSIRYRKNKHLYAIFLFLTSIFLLGLITSSRSTRSLIQMTNIYNNDLLPNPASVVTLKELGMPAPESIEYQAWFQKNSTKTLIKFMLIHPGYPTLKILKDFPLAFTEIKQTYFHMSKQDQTRELLMEIGKALHPENTTPFLMDIFLLFGLILFAKKQTNITSQPWAWIGVWLFLTASITLVPTILGDTWAINRHALFSTMIYRLFMWVYTIIVMDIALIEVQKPPIHIKHPDSAKVN